MPKTFYTDTDIQELVVNGVTMLHVDEDIVLTMVAKETAVKLGLQLVYDTPDTEAAPYRAPVRIPKEETLEERVRAAVLSHIGPDADARMVNTAISQAMSQLESSR